MPFTDWSQPYKLQDAAVAVGNGNAWAVNNRGAVSVTISGITTATISWEISTDNSVWFGIPALNLTTQVSALTATADGIYYISLPGVVFIRARISAWTTGTITVTAIAIPFTASPSNGLAAGLGATAAKQDTGNTSLTTISTKLTGAANIAISQATAGSASGVLVAARATRRTVVVRNHDATVSAYIGTGTVTSANGFLLKAGESISIETVAALNCIRDTTDAVLGIVEIYD